MSAADPLLSVVVPVYQGAAFLRTVLGCVLEQRGVRLEVVVVDDGSTDGSGDVARAVAARDPRVRVVTQENRGLGCARNVGVRHARGDLLAFADADDVVPPGAYAVLVGALLRSGSDLATGAVTRQVGDEAPRVPGWMVPVHRRRRLAARLEDVPGVLGELFVWNKVFRRTFWDDAGLAFPERVHYEDHVLTVRAHLAARSIDVVPEVVYRWRVREGAGSITQRKHETGNMLDALAARRESTALVTAGAPPAVARSWQARMLNGLPAFVARAPRDDAYWDHLREGVGAVLDSMPSAALAAAPVRARVLCWLVAHAERAVVDDLHARLEGPREQRPPTRVRDGRAELDLSGLPGVEELLPDGLLRLAEVDRRPQLRLTDLGRVVGVTDRLHLSGVARLVGADLHATGAPEVTLLLRPRDVVPGEAEGARDIEVPCTTTVQDRSEPEPGEARPVAFTAELDPVLLGPRLPRDADLAVEVRVRHDGATADGWFATKTFAHPPPRGLPAPQGSWELGWRPGPGLELRTVTR